MAGDKLKCWEYFNCFEKACPVYQLREILCWLVSGTFCRKENQGKLLEKIELCLGCDVLKENMDMEAMEATLRSLTNQLKEFKGRVQERDTELEGVSMELALGLSEAFEALQKLASGDPFVRIDETSELELIRKLKRLVNRTAEEFSEIVDLSHEFAIGLAEHFDVLHRVSKGDLGARVSGTSKLELLELLKKITNQMIESVSNEITERKRAEEALRDSEAELRESEQKYRSLFDSGPDPLFVLDRETFEILDVNASTEETYGYSKEELIGHSFLDLGLFQDDETGLSFFTADTASDFCFAHSKLRHFKKGRKPFYVNVHACPTTYREKEAIIFSVTDITEMLEKDAQLIQASKMTTLGELSTGIAHELNQPLNAIKMGNEFLKMMIEQGEEISEQQLHHVVSEVNDQVDRATEIINRLREFGRKADFSKEKININQSIRDVLSIIGRQLSLQNIKVKLDLDETIPPILAQKNRLEQVIFNLVTNARDAISQKMESKAHPDSARIMIRTAHGNGLVTLSISDTGIGIPHSILERVFEPFFTTKEVGKGVGLGLSITYGIVKDFGGEINVDSEAGKGATFQITFPCSPAS
jgi:PAS domain S-box-containing protein